MSMSSSTIECITLDDSEEEQAVGVPGVRPLDGLPGPAQPRHEPRMSRCNFCVDPGLLPVETDRAKHR